MCQCPREIPSGRVAEACCGPRLVIAQTVSVVVLPLICPTRSRRHTCFTPGRSRYPDNRAVVRILRVSTRPCLLSRTSSWASSYGL